MKTLYYYIRWLIKGINFKPDSMYLVFLATICFLTGIIMNVMGIMFHSDIDPTTGHLRVWTDNYWPEIGDKFLFAGFVLYAIFVIWNLVIKGIRNSFRRFKQEQRDLLFTIDNSDKKGRKQ